MSMPSSSGTLSAVDRDIVRAKVMVTESLVKMCDCRTKQKHLQQQETPPSTPQGGLSPPPGSPQAARRIQNRKRKQRETLQKEGPKGQELQGMVKCWDCGQ
ncbi:hypothetical protein BaRGS_00017720 [Batillaria attramentaria]|uniref:Uncharacterized protein n=1 Tax=Batillaria attramentaria TaxID=370345 RepID=A0ABD0KUX9_9CAEN